MSNSNPMCDAVTLSICQDTARTTIKSTPFDDTPKILSDSDSNAENPNNTFHYFSRSESSFEYNDE